MKAESTENFISRYDIEYNLELESKGIGKGDNMNKTMGRFKVDFEPGK